MTSIARARLVAYVVGLGAPLAVLVPCLPGAPDSFPLSTYPMFTRSPGIPTLHALVGVTPAGAEQRLPPALVASGEVLQTKVMIERAVAQGPRAMATLCESIAERVAAASDAPGIQFIDVVRRRYDPVAYFVSGAAPLEQSRLLRCSVPRRSGVDPRRGS
jgi:hypothetical protein